jgi:hypothetical protein
MRRCAVREQCHLTRPKRQLIRTPRGITTRNKSVAIKPSPVPRLVGREQNRHRLRAGFQGKEGCLGCCGLRCWARVGAGAGAWEAGLAERRVRGDKRINATAGSAALTAARHCPAPAKKAAPADCH